MAAPVGAASYRVVVSICNRFRLPTPLQERSPFDSHDGVMIAASTCSVHPCLRSSAKSVRAPVIRLAGPTRLELATSCVTVGSESFSTDCYLPLCCRISAPEAAISFPVTLSLAATVSY